MRILLYTDLAIEPHQLFWHRDLGLLTRTLCQMGHHATLAIHPAATTAPPLPPLSPPDPVLWVSQTHVRDPKWWQSHQPDLVILGLWTRPKYDAVRRAVLTATTNVIERADSDGMRTASCSLGSYAKRRFDYLRDSTAAWPAILSLPLSATYSLLSVLATPWMERRLARTLTLIPRLAVETPGAAELWRKLCLRLAVPSSAVRQIPHPVQTSLFQFTPEDRKRNRVVAAGRWNSYQKNLPALLESLRVFLRTSPDWEAEIVGHGLPHHSSVPRCRFFPNEAPTALAKRFRSAKILLFSSRYESFHLAGAEALTAGCSVVGPLDTVSRDYFSSFFSPFPAPEGIKSLAAGLLAERDAWSRGQRIPQQISTLAAGEFSAETVAEKFLHFDPAS